MVLRYPRRWFRCYTLVALALLAACGSQSTGAPGFLDARGVWRGTLDYPGGLAEGCVALSAASGDAWLVPWEDGAPLRTHEAYRLDLATSDGALEGFLIFYDAFGRAAPVGSVGGRLVPRSSVSGQFSGGLASGCELVFDAADHDRGASLAEFAGRWAGAGPSGYGFTLDANADGSFTASYADGETYSGRFVILDKNSTVRSAKGETDLGGVVLPFQGLAALLGGAGPGQTLLLTLAQTVPSGVPLFPTTTASRVHWAHRAGPG